MIPRIRFHYTLTLENGTPVESTVGKEPAIFIAGQNEIMPSLESVMIGMKSGETKKILIKAADELETWQENLQHI